MFSFTLFASKRFLVIYQNTSLKQNLTDISRLLSFDNRKLCLEVKMEKIEQSSSDDFEIYK